MNIVELIIVGAIVDMQDRLILRRGGGIAYEYLIHLGDAILTSMRLGPPEGKAKLV